MSLNPFTGMLNSVLANTVGKVVDGAVGKFLPATMSEADKADVALKMKDYVVREIEADTTLATAVNTTMQTEAKSEKWWVSGWRPYWGFIAGTVYGVVGLVLAVAVIKMAWEKPAQLFANLPMIIGAFATYFSIAGAVLGITSWHRGKKQRIEAGEGAL